MINLFRKLFKKPLKRIVFDIECDGLLEELTKMHCFVGFDLDNKVWIKTTDPFEAARVLNDPNVEAIGHYINMYDLPALRKLTGIDIKPGLVTDTLPIAQYLDPKKVKHGLEIYGEDFGIEKPKIDDWENLTEADYLHRCSEDVKINCKLYVSQMRRLDVLYEGDKDKIQELIGYLNFKFDCLEEQYRNPISLDFNLLFNELFKLTAQRDVVKEELVKHMPKVIKRGMKKKPEKFYKKDGTVSAAGEKWESLLQSLGYSPSEAESLEEVEVILSEEDPNPDSNDQLKQWLFSLGWEPCTFKSVEDKEKSKEQKRKVYRQVPQISDLDDKTKLTPSVLRLAEVNPAVEFLAGYSTLKHRVGILEGFIRDSNNGKIISDASGITNTLRLKHRIIVNLPKPHAAYGAHIRECLIAPEGYYMVGADLSGIEDNTKQHYIFPYDPDYVESMRTPGFDPHIRIAELAKMITEEEGSFFKWYEGLSSEEKEKLTDEEHSKYKRIKKVRGDAKPVNFCVPVDNTEVLTPSGWKTYKELSVGDEIFSYKDGELVITNITDLPFYKNSEVGVLKNKNWAFECTENHRWVVNRVQYSGGTRGNYFETISETKDLKYEDLILNSAPYLNKGKFLKEDCALLGWVLSDGYLSASKLPEGSSSSWGRKKGMVCSISQKKYPNQLREDLKAAGMSFKEDLREDGVHIFRLPAQEVRNFLDRLELPYKSKHDIDYTKFMQEAGFEGRELFLDRFFLADGGNKKGRGKLLETKLIYQNEGKINEAVQLCATLQGYKYTTSSQKTYTGKMLAVTRLSGSRHTTKQRMTYTRSRQVDVFCCNNENSTFVIRQNGLVSITGNSATYGVGKKKLAMTGGFTEDFAELLLETYWGLNWAVKQFAADQEVKTIAGQMWVKQPVSGFWYSLRATKDIFSTVNQSTAVYVFDCWVKYLREEGIAISLQYHDECLLIVDNQILVSEIEIKIMNAIKKVNDLLKLNVEIKCSFDVGQNYKQVH